MQLPYLGTLAALMGRTSSISQWESRMEGKLKGELVQCHP